MKPKKAYPLLYWINFMKYKCVFTFSFFSKHWDVTGSWNPSPERHSLILQRQCHFAGDIFKCILFNEDVWIPIKISLKFIPKGAINNILAMVQMMAWRRPGDKPLSEPMVVSLPTHICVTRPQWVKFVCALILFTRWWQYDVHGAKWWQGCVVKINDALQKHRWHLYWTLLLGTRQL